MTSSSGRAVAEARLRLFVAVELPEHVRGALAQAMAALRVDLHGPYRWLALGSIHLTLKFLGEVAPSRVGVLSRTLEDAVTPLVPFELRLEGAGAFPNERKPRVLWAGLGGSVEALVALRSAVETSMVGANQAPERQAFHPHLTLARVRSRLAPGDAERLTDRLRRVSFGDGTAFRVADVALMRSELRSTGAVYTRLACAPLKGGAGLGDQHLPPGAADHGEAR